MCRMSYDRLNEAFNRLRAENKQLKNDLDLHDIRVATDKAQIKFLEESMCTPGPWKYTVPTKDTPTGYRYEIFTDEDEPWHIASIAGGANANDFSDGIEELANARLIAASPLLYEYVVYKAKEGDLSAINLLKTLD